MKTKRLFLAATALAFMAFVPKPSTEKTLNIVIDAGHGGKDFGAKIDSEMEKVIVGQISAQMKVLNQDERIQLHFTRDSDEFISLEDRAKKSETVKADAFISLHVNSNPNTEKSGVETYFPSEGAFKEASLNLAIAVGNKIGKNHKLEVNSPKEAPFYVLKNAKAPAVVVELGYLTNANDRKLLTDPASQQHIAKTILEVISELE